MHNNFFRAFCFNNFPFLEKEFDALTDYELISKIFEYLDNQIKEVDEKYSGFGNEVESLKQEFNQLKSDINIILEQFKNDLTNSINNSVNEKLNEQYTKIIQLFSDYQIIFNNQIENLREDLENQIESIELGNVLAYNPTNGLVENVSKVIMDVYEVLRNMAITCTEFDMLELTATEFDSKEITAYNFDVNGKEFLINNI